MKRALAALVALWTGACTSGGPPRLEVTSAVVGRESPGSAETTSTLRAPVPPGAIVTARYEILNAGGRDLLLHDVAPACGCGLSSALPDALAPGEAATLAVRCRAPRTSGDAVRETLLRSSDPARPEEHLRIPMTVAAGVAADPPALYFGYVAVGGSTTRELVAAAGGGSGGPASGLPVVGDPAFTVEARPPRTDGRSAFLVRFTPTAPGVQRTMLTLVATDEVPLVGVGFQTLLALPAEVMPSGGTPGGSSVITLKNVGEEPLEITRVELPPDVAGDLVPTTPGREWRLAVRSHASRTSAGPPIRIHTSAASLPALEIPVRRADAP